MSSLYVRVLNIFYKDTKYIFHVCTKNPTPKASCPRHLSCCIMTQKFGSNWIRHCFIRLSRATGTARKLAEQWAKKPSLVCYRRQSCTSKPGPGRPVFKEPAGLFSEGHVEGECLQEAAIGGRIEATHVLLLGVADWAASLPGRAARVKAKSRVSSIVRMLGWGVRLVSFR
jgi:hypothetical protein